MVVLRMRIVALTIGLLWLCGTLPVVAAAPTVSSLSAVVYEPESGLVLYEKAGDTPRPMASTTKLMTALLAAERLQPDAVVTVPAAALPVEGSQVGLAVGDTLTVRDLLTGLLLASGNDTANALALLMADSLAAFAALMNRRAAELGMEQSCFVTPSGLDEGEHSASARDMALLGAAVLEHPLLAQLCAARTADMHIGDRSLTLSNHNKLLTLLPDCIGLKTGFTKKSGRCLVSAVCRDGITLVVATLNGGDYWNDHIALYDYGFSLVSRQPLPDTLPVDCPVAGGTTERVAITAALPESVVVRADESITLQVELSRFVWAPIQTGDILGTVRCRVGERTEFEVPLTAAVSVAARPMPSTWALILRRYRQLAEVLLT